MYDKARSHTARIVHDCIEKSGFGLWSCQYSPDLNPIKHLCDELKRRIHTRLHPPTSADSNTQVYLTWHNQQNKRKKIKEKKNK